MSMTKVEVLSPEMIEKFSRVAHSGVNALNLAETCVTELPDYVDWSEMWIYGVWEDTRERAGVDTSNKSGLAEFNRATANLVNHKIALRGRDS